jgi:hypothetical protein
VYPRTVDFVLGLKSVYGFHTTKVKKISGKFLRVGPNTITDPSDVAAPQMAPRETMDNTFVTVRLMGGKYKPSRNGDFALMAPEMNARREGEDIIIEIGNGGDMIVQPREAVDKVIARLDAEAEATAEAPKEKKA